MEIEKLKAVIESLLFVSGEPVKLLKIAKITGVPKPEVENALMLLMAEYQGQKKGLLILRKDEMVQMATNPDNAEFVQQMMEGELQEALSPAALEVLSVVAYKAPITRAEIEAIRGVNCSYTLRNLLMRGLIERSDNPKDNRGYVYGVSFEFLKKLGLTELKELPDYESLSQDARGESIVEVKNTEGV